MGLWCLVGCPLLFKVERFRFLCFLIVRATGPQLIRYTCGPGRSLNCCMSQRYRDQRGHKPELTVGKYAPKAGSPMESPHNQHLRLKGKGDIQIRGEISDHLSAQLLRTRRGAGYPKITKVRKKGRNDHIRILYTRSGRDDHVTDVTKLLKANQWPKGSKMGKWYYGTKNRNRGNGVIRCDSVQMAKRVQNRNQWQKERSCHRPLDFCLTYVL